MKRFLPHSFFIIVLILLAGTAHAYTYEDIRVKAAFGAQCGVDVNGNDGVGVPPDTLLGGLGPDDTEYSSQNPDGTVPSGFFEDPTKFCNDWAETYRCGPDGCDSSGTQGWVKYSGTYISQSGEEKRCYPLYDGCVVAGNHSFALNADQLPNLSAETPTVQTPVTLGQSEDLSTLIDNDGIGNATTSFNNLYEISSSSPNFDVGYNALIAGTKITSLSAGDNAPTTATWTPKNATTYYVRVCADESTSWQGSVNETDEGDNCGPTATFTVTAPNALYLCGKNDGTGTISGTVGEPVDIPVQGSTSNGDDVRYAVNFDGSTSTSTPHPDVWLPSAAGSYASGYSTNATHTWDTAGTYTVEGTNEDVATNTYSKWTACKVTIRTANDPSVSCTPSPTSGEVGDTITWTASYKDFSGTPTITWSDSDGNPRSGSGNPFKNSYGSKGSYSPEVTATYAPAGESADNNCSPVQIASFGDCDGKVSNTIDADQLRVATGTIDTIRWVAKGVPEGENCTVTGPNIGGKGVNSLRTDTAGKSCDIDGDSGSANPEIDTQSTYTITCPGAVKAWVTVDVVPIIQED